MNTQISTPFSISAIITTVAIDAASVLGTATNAMLSAVKSTPNIYGWRDSTAMKNRRSMDQTTEDIDDVGTLMDSNDDSPRYTPLSPSDLYEAASKLSRAAEAAANGEDEIACAHYLSALASTLAAGAATTTFGKSCKCWYLKTISY
jgi:hypothetical protein